ncbi:MAG: DUF2851 family protein, partial [Bacteroidia bacterium]|nr:DUF2851 family protein [Bacteroidia bacterium]
LKIGKTLWAGNVEVHLRSSDWKRHNHQLDKAYDNIILHVVYRDDEKLFRRNGEQIPTLQLEGKFDDSLFKKYLKFKAGKDWVPCASQLKSVADFTINSWLHRVLAERLECKTEVFFQSLEKNKNNWEETFYQQVARSFGFKINSIPFELLAKSIPNAVLAKHKNSLFQIEALLFGQAGLLNKQFKDTYPQYLQTEYEFLRKKYKLQPIDSHLWKFMRLRPSNFPSIRIAQFADLIHKSVHLFSKIIETSNPDNLKKLFDLKASDYWETHYTFDNKSSKKIKSLGSEGVHSIIINTIVPFLFVYGKNKGETKYTEQALMLLESIPPEKNATIANWKKFGIKSVSAYQTQALLQLKNEYCTHKRCLQCAIGVKLIQS